MSTRLEDLDLNQSYTYLDYLTWQFKERVELLRGRLVSMSPAPGRLHQEVSRNVLVAMAVFLKGRPCKVDDAPFDVVLSIKDNNTLNRYKGRQRRRQNNTLTSIHQKKLTHKS